MAVEEEGLRVFQSVKIKIGKRCDQRGRIPLPVRGPKGRLQGSCSTERSHTRPLLPYCNSNHTSFPSTMHYLGPAIVK